MRWRFWKRTAPGPDPYRDEETWEHPVAAVAAAAREAFVDPQMFRVGDQRILRGWLRYGAADGRARLRAALAGLDVTWFVETVDGRDRATITHPRPPRVPPEWRWNLAGFLLTGASTIWAGATLEGVPWSAAWRAPGELAAGVPFAAALLAILAAHELGHYVAARHYGLDATLPFFLPLPVLSPIGTLGAVIRMKTPIYTRRMLLDVGAAGPLAGLVVAIPVLIIGLSHSPVLPVEASVGIQLGEPLLFKLLLELFAPVPAGHDVYLGAVAFAGWVGLFVTALNLLPVGQLDGGHILFALSPRAQRWIAWPFFATLVVLGFWWTGWFVWAALLLLVVRLRHPPVLDPEIGLDAPRRAVAWACIALFAVCFSPVPFEIA